MTKGISKRRADSCLAGPALQIPPGTEDLAATGFIGGLAVSRDGTRLYAVHVLGRAVSLVDLKGGQSRRTLTLFGQIVGWIGCALSLEAPGRWLRQGDSG